MIKDFISRKIFERLLKKYPFPCKLIVGANGDRYPGWLSTEKSYFDITNGFHWRKYFDIKVPVSVEEQIGEREELVDGVKTMVKYQKEIPEEKIEWRKMEVIQNILADHVLQELTNHDAIIALELAHQYLTPGGTIRVAVPDAGHNDKKFINLMQQQYPGYHYDKTDLIRTMRSAGFTRFKVKEGFDAGGLFNISTWYRIDGYCKRSFWYDPNNMVGDTGMFWSCLIIDAIKE
jgi:predicted SAM-dependent methyltransferase